MDYSSSGQMEEGIRKVKEIESALTLPLLTTLGQRDRSCMLTHPLEEGDGGVLATSKLQPQQIITLNDTKAGMEGLDLEKINKIITETSEGSKFYDHKRKVKERLEQKAREIRQQYDDLSSTAIKESERKIDRIAAEVERTRDDSRIIVHIDMDCFFAAVETRDNPSLSNQPMAVGSLSMLSTSNYIARKFGVRAAMPGFIAKKLCPNLIIIPCDFEKYSVASSIAHEVYKQYDPECYSCMDEASLDITYYVRSHAADGEDENVKTEEIVREIRQKVETATNGLTCSAGISPNGFLSKICSDINKPNGQFRLLPSEVRNFINQLKIRKVCGIGEATENLLRSLNISNCGHIWERRGAVNLLFKPATVDFLLRISLGLGKHFFTFPSGSENTSNSSSDDRKSISCERTFSETGNLGILTELCERLSAELAQDMKSKDCKGRAVAVKIKTDKFDVKSRIRTLFDYTADSTVIFKTAMSILESLRREQEGMILRLLGVRISTLKFKNSKDETERSDTSAVSSTKQFWQNFMEPETKAECPICGKSFVTSFSLRKHVDECLDREEMESTGANNQDSAVDGSSDRGMGTCSTTPTKRDYNESESSDNKVSAGDLEKTADSYSVETKRIKTETETLSNGYSRNSQGKQQRKGHSGIKSKASISSPMKMMPINFYFQNQEEKNTT